MYKKATNVLTAVAKIFVEVVVFAAVKDLFIAGSDVQVLDPMIVHSGLRATNNNQSINQLPRIRLKVHGGETQVESRRSHRCLATNCLGNVELRGKSSKK